MKKLVATFLAVCFLLFGAGEGAWAGVAESTAPAAVAAAAHDASDAAMAAEVLSQEACEPTCGDETPDGPDAVHRALAEPRGGDARPEWAAAGECMRTSHPPAPPTRPPRAG